MTAMAPKLDARRSSWIDPESGVTERAFFSGPEGQQVFAVSYLPSTEPRGLVLVSSSLLADRVRTYRAEVDVARAVAADGFAVARYDYRGFGHSDGESGMTTIDRMLEDLQLVHRQLTTSVGDGLLVHLGVRFGSIVAAAGAGRFGGDVVFWEPALSGRSYFREAFRAHMIGRLKHEDRAETPEQRLASSGTAEVLGYTVTDTLRDSAGAVGIEQMTAEARRLLWVSFGDALGNRQQRLVDEWRSTGIAVDVVTVAMEDSTWFIGARPIVGDDVVAHTAGWIRSLAS